MPVSKHQLADKRPRSAARAATPRVDTEPSLFDTVRPRPIIVGTGLIALDVVYGADKSAEPSLAAGGTCGNVLTALSYMGWKAYPVARLASDGAGDWVRDDLRRWGVQLDFAGLPNTAGTPVVVQRIVGRADGTVIHRFSLSCRHCGRWLPTYQAVTGSAMADVVTRLPRPDVCFIDRASRGAVVLAEWAKESGALVYTEPSGRSTPEQLACLLGSAHILKYSSDHSELVERARSVQRKGITPSMPWLEIETLGVAGLRYRSAHTRGWHFLKANALLRTVDSAGAGDWCTAGILHVLGQAGADVVEHAPRDIVNGALAFGQALSAWTCGYEGARGGMYAVTKPAFRAAVLEIVGGAYPEPRDTNTAIRVDGEQLALCRDCTVSVA